MPARIKITVPNLTPSQVEEQIKYFRMSHPDVYIFSPVYYSEKEFKKDWANIKAMPTVYKWLADTQSIKYYGRRIESIVYDLIQWFAQEVEVEDPTLVYIPSTTKTLLANEAYLASVDNQISYTASAHNVFMVSPWVKTLPELETQYEKYINQSDEARDFADHEAIRLYGIDNVKLFQYLDTVLSRQIDGDDIPADDTEDESDDDDNLEFYDGLRSDVLEESAKGVGPKIRAATDNLEYFDRIRSSIRESASSITEAAIMVNQVLQEKPQSLVEELYQNMLHEEFIDTVVDNQSVIANAPYFLPWEMENLGVFNPDNNLYSPTPDNNKIGIKDGVSDTNRHWYLNYMAKCIGLRPAMKTMYTKWYETVHHLTSTMDKLGSRNQLLNRKQSILELGWNPEVPFTDSNIAKANQRVNNLLKESLGYDFIDMTGIVVNESVDKIQIQQAIQNGLFIHFFTTEDGTTIDHNHPRVAVSNIASLTKLYSVEDGLIRQPINLHRSPADANIHLTTYFCKPPISCDVANGLSKISNQNYEYSFINYICTQLGVHHMEVANEKLYCVHLVNMIMELCRTGLGSTILVSPSNIANLRKDSVNKDHIYTVFDGRLTDYLDQIPQITARALNTINIVSEDIRPYLEITPFQEGSGLAIELDKDCNIFIRKRHKLNLADEYAVVHRFLLSYSKAKSYDIMKYYVAKLWYMNALLENKIRNPKKFSNAELTKAYNTRAHVLADFKKYLDEILAVDNTFDFRVYYNKTPFARKGGITIPKTVWATGYNMIKTMLGLPLPSIDPNPTPKITVNNPQPQKQGSKIGKLLQDVAKNTAGLLMNRIAQKAMQPAAKPAPIQVMKFTGKPIPRAKYPMIYVGKPKK